MPFVLTRKLEGVDVYWCGDRHVSGEPRWTMWLNAAFKTKTSDGLLDAVATHPEINQDVWKVHCWKDHGGN
jgi:hypothetical protein